MAVDATGKETTDTQESMDPKCSVKPARDRHH